MSAGFQPTPEQAVAVAAYLNNFQVPNFIGNMISVFALGALTVMVAYYYFTYRHDPISWRVGVGVSFVATTASVTGQLAAIFFVDVLINPFDQFAIHPSYQKCLKFALPLTVLPMTIAQLWYTHRAWKMTKNRPFLVVAMVLIAVACGSNLASVIETVRKPFDFTPGQSAVEDVPLRIALWTAAGADIWITMFFVAYLLRQTSGFNATTDFILAGLVKMAIATTAVTSLLAVASAVAQLYSTTSGAFLATIQPMHLSYPIGMLLTLNLRKHLEERARAAGHHQRFDMDGNGDSASQYDSLRRPSAISRVSGMEQVGGSLASAKGSRKSLVLVVGDGPHSVSEHFAHLTPTRPSPARRPSAADVHTRSAVVDM